MCPLLLPNVYFPAKRLLLPLQLAAEHSYAQLHALPLLLLQVENREHTKKDFERKRSSRGHSKVWSLLRFIEVLKFLKGFPETRFVFVALSHVSLA